MVDVGNVAFLMLQATCLGYCAFPSEANFYLPMRKLRVDGARDLFSGAALWQFPIDHNFQPDFPIIPSVKCCG